jgi:ATP-binding cassette subfamily B multidrug efflux pump
MKKYLKYIKPYLIYFILGPIFMLTEVFGEIWIPRLMSFIINNGVANRDVAYIFKIGGVMFCACLVMVIGGIGGAYFAAKASVSFSADLRSDLFKKIQGFSFADLDEFSTGSLVTRLTNDLQQIQNMIAMSLRMALRAPGMLVGGFIMALGLNSELAMILLIVIPLLGISIFLIMRTAYPLFGKMQTALDNLNNGIKETLTNIRVVKSFVREDHELQKFTGLNDELKDKTLKAMNIVIMTMPVMTVFMNITSCAVVWFGGNRIIAGDMPVGDLTAFITYVTQILMSLMMVAMVILTSSRSMASFARVSELLKFEPELNDENAASRDKLVESGSIEFKNVAFAYKKTNVLKNISFKVEPGETIGILGPTGCGKTSMVQLIPRLYDVTEGEVLVDGTDVRDYSLKNLREGVGMVLQYNTLFAGTVYENLRWGNEDADDEEVRRFAAYAQADGFVSEFKEGYEHMIEQGGSNVSGGQKQRLCIARALLKRPKILILDDSTSAVDTATERRINEAFNSELKGTTKLIIAQRVSSVKDADRIIVMEDGSIVDIGNHEELISRCEEYKAIYYSQVDKEKEEVSA